MLPKKTLREQPEAFDPHESSVSRCRTVVSLQELSWFVQGANRTAAFGLPLGKWHPNLIKAGG